MSANPTPKALPGFCPYCGYENPPTYNFCVSCRRRLPDVLGQALPKPGAPPTPSAAEGAQGAAPTGATPNAAIPSDFTESAPRGRPWVLVPIAIVIIVVLALLGAQLLPVYLAGHPASSPPPPPPGKIISLCIPDNGSNCKGASFTLPITVSNHEMNTSTCDSFASLGADETLWMNYSASANIYAIVLPSSVFGESPGWTEGAFALVHNETAVGSALFYSGLASGGFSETIRVPDNGGTYCIGWWEPSNVAVSVTWLNDLNLTYS